MRGQAESEQAESCAYRNPHPVVADVIDAPPWAKARQPPRLTGEDVDDAIKKGPHVGSVGSDGLMHNPHSSRIRGKGRLFGGK